jgi:prepilin-type N-terminal cleavage/methylation domain-containing protein
MLTGQKDKGKGIFPYLRVLRVKKSGFTLVEILVVSLLLGIVVAALFLTMNISQSSSSLTSAKLDLQSRVRRLSYWIAKDVRQTNLIQINTNNPTPDHIQFKRVIGINNATGNYLVDTNYIEYSYNNTTQELARNELDASQTIVSSWAFDNITASPFYSAPGVPLTTGGILSSKKLFVVISSESQVKRDLVLNCTLSGEVKVRNE